MTEAERNTVFVVDDDEAIRSGLSMLLATYGYGVETFPTPHAFLDRCKRPLPERFMVILDLAMPDMNGLELQAELIRRQIRVPTVFLSGEGDIPAAVSAVRNGAVDFVEKPVDTGLLVNRIEAALGQQLDEREHDAGTLDTRSRLDSLTDREREGAGETGRRQYQQGNRVRARNQRTDRRAAPVSHIEEDGRPEQHGVAQPGHPGSFTE